MSQKVRRNDREVLRERGHELFPGLGAPRDAVEQHEDGTLARDAVTDQVTVEVELSRGNGHGLVARAGGSPVVERTLRMDRANPGETQGSTSARLPPWALTR